MEIHQSLKLLCFSKWGENQLIFQTSHKRNVSQAAACPWQHFWAWAGCHGAGCKGAALVAVSVSWDRIPHACGMRDDLASWETGHCMWVQGWGPKHWLIEDLQKWSRGEKINGRTWLLRNTCISGKLWDLPRGLQACPASPRRCLLRFKWVSTATFSTGNVYKSNQAWFAGGARCWVRVYFCSEVCQTV